MGAAAAEPVKGQQGRMPEAGTPDEADAQVERQLLSEDEVSKEARAGLIGEGAVALCSLRLPSSSACQGARHTGNLNMHANRHMLMPALLFSVAMQHH